jgi:PAS domain S-box-containing protein
MSGPAIKVLLIDDDESAFVITRSLLAKSPLTSYGLDWVDTYEAGLEALLAGQHDVYLIDYHLHARNGLDLMREVLAQGCTAPMILLTGQGDWETDLEATRAGAADYLQKGEFDAHSLERSIRYALAHRCAADLLRRREKYFRALLENTSDLVTVIDRDGVVLYQSPSSRALLGRSPHSMNGRSLWKWIAPEDLAILHRAYLAAWRGEGVLPCLEVRLQHENGSWRTFEVVGNSFEFDSGVEQMRPGDCADAARCDGSQARGRCLAKRARFQRGPARCRGEFSRCARLSGTHCAF